MLGTFRFLTTSRGHTGAFAAVHSDLDAAAYRLDTRYGDNFAEVTVSAVPEPSSVTLLVLGAGWLMARRYRRAARTPGHGRTR
ncbi:PEP-CTERM sorting domain-containing protein [Eleftheria terrae]|uniref:PEP-CTERM sorting domain-containing protein n=1 Tax=Eleftheria terrae TaxID=1597781 RepID=UPI00263B62C7|nr:PEP-CTERM sorting domain-containing protein [Eleftheria terrae]WKB56167.1 PEP-CTERM sorting domain-containing protein [Eleftheria terrae]